MATHFPNRVWHIVSVKEHTIDDDEFTWASKPCTRADRERRIKLCYTLFPKMEPHEIAKAVGTVDLVKANETTAQRIERQFNDMSPAQRETLLKELRT